jgi:hypothetical protein
VVESLGRQQPRRRSRTRSPSSTAEGGDQNEERYPPTTVYDSTVDERRYTPTTVYDSTVDERRYTPTTVYGSTAAVSVVPPTQWEHEEDEESEQDTRTRWYAPTTAVPSEPGEEPSASSASSWYWRQQQWGEADWRNTDWRSGYHRGRW